MASVKQLAMRGAVLTLLGFGTTMLLRLGSNVILTRLLVPEFFGLMALISVLQIGLSLFTDVGIGQSVIQSKLGDDRQFLNTAWTIQVIRGLLVWVICVALAWPMAQIYEEERLRWLIPIVAFTAVLNGFNSMSIFSLNRYLKLDKLLLFNLTGLILSIVVMVVWSLIHPTIWALVSGAWAASLYTLVGSYLLLPNSGHRFAWDRRSLDDLASFGRWVFISTTMVFFAEQSDRLILGKLLTFELLGIYNIAFTLASLPRTLIKQISNKVIFPAVSRKSEMPRHELRSKLLQQRQRVLLGLACVISIPVGLGDYIVDILYDNRYDQAMWMLPILCAGIWFAVLFYSMSPALMGIGKPIYLAQANTLRFLTIVIGVPLGFFQFGIPGAITSIALSDLPSYLAIVRGLWLEKLHCFRQDLLATLLFVGLVMSICLGRQMMGVGLPIDAIL